MQLSKILTTLKKVVATNNAYYRGAESADLTLGDFPLDRPANSPCGVWMSSDRHNSKQYGKLWKIQLKPNVKIASDSEITKLVQKYYDVDEDEIVPLLMYPKFDFVRFAKKRGYSGYKNGLYDVFIFDYKDVDKIEATT